jgi:hypothetical protein
MKELKLGKDALTMSIMTLITVLTWTGLEVYRTYSKTTIAEVTQEQMSPLNPILKTEVIDTMKTSLTFSEEELNAASIGSQSAVLGVSKKK